MNESIIKERKCTKISPVGRNARTVLAKMQETRVAEDAEFALEKPRWGAHGTLYLALDDKTYEDLHMAGIPCACVVPESGDKPSFSGAAFLLSRPDDIEASSFEKIYRRLYHIPWVIAQTDRLLLREMTESDLDALYALYDGEALRFLPPLDADRGREKQILRAYIEKVYGLAGYGYWAVIERSGGELVGRAGFGIPEREDAPAELGYLIRKDKRGQGYAKEAVRAVLSYERENLHFPGILARTHRENIPSRALLSSLGFSPAGEEPGDILVYAL